MQVLQELADKVTRAVGLPELCVEPMWHSNANDHAILKGEQDGDVFFAKIFTDADITALDANIRYGRELSVLSRSWQVATPALIYYADDDRVVVTREVAGEGFADFIQEGRSLEALGFMARWIAGFHKSTPARPCEGTLWDHFSQFGELQRNPGFWALEPLLTAQPLTEYVLTKGDCACANFKFAKSRAVGLDFEGVAYRAKEFDLVALIRGLHALTGEAVADMVDTVIEQYNDVRPIDDPEATAEVVKSLVTISE